ncbi:tRNA (adenine(22)-N(1))-methyltransferase TrmK [Shewanella sp. MBTL60-007]|uniref:tRNA (adenine(22)-N(1))-methyltransferase n=1 Tax=Shewanella sp. MBTL60-007 TaxID=2815911 RepID=UPI001C8208A2|nr:tRNA (adenine(22)-N(1))-methyltransferase TrmK [Shewanella sp. MBTL60-007]
MSPRTPLKISQRLQHINTLINAPYDHIWDCCCDHGLLGAALLKRKAARNIHFVDVVPNLMFEVKLKLQRFFPDGELDKPSLDIASLCVPSADSLWQVHCVDVAKLDLAEKSQRQLIIIAGVGGDLTIELVQQIMARHPQHSLEFILCPVHHIYKVRTAMQQLGLGLVNEHLMQENKRFYEILHLSTTSQIPLTSVGSVMWDMDRELDRDYLQKSLKHYRNIDQGLLKTQQNGLLTAEQQKEKTTIDQVIAEYQGLGYNPASLLSPAIPSQLEPS